MSQGWNSEAKDKILKAVTVDWQTSASIAVVVGTGRLQTSLTLGRLTDMRKIQCRYKPDARGTLRAWYRQIPKEPEKEKEEKDNGV